MSGLVSGLQNRVRRFESARYLLKSLPLEKVVFLFFSAYTREINSLSEVKAKNYVFVFVFPSACTIFAT